MDPMTKDELACLMRYDATLGRLVWIVNKGRAKIGEPVGHIDREGYRRLRIGGRQYLEHRLVWMWHHGEFPRILDHIDRDRSNNRIDNLRPCHESENAANAGAPSSNTSGYRGVYFDTDRMKWVARIRYTRDGVRHRYRIGRYTTADEAAVHYNLHMRKLFPDFALLNRVDTPLGRMLGMNQ